MIPTSQLRIHICLLLATLFSGVCAQYIGCFREGLIDQRLLPDTRRGFDSDLTPEKCIEHCSRNGYSYAGVQDGWECFCAKKHPDFTQLATEEDECSTPCRGNTNKKCGGAWRMGVFALKDGNKNFVLRNYKGCYQNSPKEKDVLTSLKKNFNNILTPELCVGYCFRRNFELSAVHNGNECVCGNKIEGAKVNEIECGKQCSGYDRLKCGGNSASSVYDRLKCGGNSASSVYDTTIDSIFENLAEEYVGCFTDTAERLYKELMVFPDSLTPWVCIMYCYKKGYKYGALQYRFECFCGDKVFGDKVSNSECDLDCSGDSRLVCGGRYRNSIYTLKSVDAGVFVGCYSDGGDSRTFDPSTLSTMSGTNSPEACIAHCQKKGSAYAGVQYGIECYCGNERPLKRLVADDWRCHTHECPGDKSQQCGGDWRLLVYTTGL